MAQSDDKTAQGDARGGNTKRWILLAIKLAVSVGIMVFIFRKVLERENAEDLWARIEQLHWGWIALAAGAQIMAILVSVVRWDRLLVGQGIKAPFRHLFGSFLIGRFFGAFTPGGWTGLNGYRLYDIAVRTGKTARSTATIGIEMVLGQLAFGAVVIAASVFGFKYLGGLKGVIIVDGAFLGLIVVAITLLSRPALFRWIAGFLPGSIRARIQTLVDAVCAYEGKTWLVVQAALLGMGTHAFNNLIYVCAARALGLELGIGEVFFVSSMQILATLLPISIGGVGLREGAALYFYTTVAGVPGSLAVLIPIVGIAVEYSISAFGGIVFVTRKHGRDPRIVVEDEEREDAVKAEIEEVPPERQPRIVRGLTLGLGAGLLAGMIVGAGEAAVVLAKGSAETLDLGVVSYGAMAYGILCGLGGAFGGALLAWSGRLMKREAVPEPRAYARLTALMVATLAFALGAFRIRRDVFEEQLAWKSAQGLGVLLACMAGAAVLYFVLSFVLRLCTERRPGRVLLRAWGSPAVVAVLVGVVAAGSSFIGHPAQAEPGRDRPAAPARAGNVLFIVIDTLRADRLPAYGYEKIDTPHLDEFAKEAVRFDQAFAQSSWTRPSFASILTSRYAASHRTMAKSDALPGDLVTMPEAFADSGYYTTGFVTNYNLAPFFNFHQGFDEYTYMEPSYVLGANDEAAKLLFVQALKRVVEKVEGAQPGGAYQDAETVNAAVSEWLDDRPEDPFFLFVAYMDPHDPYFEHPYDGVGISRAANQNPDPSMAPRMSELYDGEIEYWDTHFGRLVADLEKRGLYEDLTIVITSDHGEEFMDHGGFWHGTTLYDEQVRVPLFVKLPHGERGGTTLGHWVELIDLMPTVLRLNGIDAPEGLQGGDAFEPSDEVYAEEEHEGNVLTALRTRRGKSELKVIEANEGNPRGLEPLEMYRMDLDPGEEVNLAEQRPAVADVATERLKFWAKQAEKGAVDRKQIDQSGANAENLRALGYAGD